MPHDNPPETTAKLRFPVWRVRRLLAHSTRCTEHMGLEGVQGAAPGAGLVLVADTTIYLASNGVDQATLDGAERIAFARGFELDEETDGQARNEVTRRMAGEADAAVFLKANDLALVLATCSDAEDLTVAITHDGSRLTRVLLVPPVRGVTATKTATSAPR